MYRPHAVGLDAGERFPPARAGPYGSVATHTNGIPAIRTIYSNYGASFGS